MSSVNGEPKQYRVPIARFGSNPYGKPLYRVVFAPTVRHLVGGKWRDGSVEYRSRPSYSHIGNEWILERWITAEEYCNMTREAYERRFRNASGLLTMGPYPSEGVYVMCMDAPIKVEAIHGISTIIEGIEFGRRNRSIARTIENGQLLAADLAASEKAKDDLMLDRISSLRPAFGNRPTSFAGRVHSTKSAPNLKISPLNIKPGSFGIMKGK